MVVVGLALTSVAAFLAGTMHGSEADADDRPAASSATTTTAPIGATPTGAADDAPAQGDDVVVAARQQAVVIPPGHHGVAITLPFTAAGGGYVGAGDKVDVFAIEPGI